MMPAECCELDAERSDAMPRIAIGRISHETNTFSPVPTNYESFAEGRSGVFEGAPLLRHFRGSKTGLGGFLEVGEAEGWEMIGTVAADATPSANVASDAHNRLKGKLISHLRSAGKVDGVLLHLHGAMLAENAPDAEGDVCRAVREVIGPNVPLFVELDLHGNITAEFCRVVDAVFAYNTNPHIDAYERGLETAQCLARVLRGEMSRPSVFISKPPMLPPTINMRTAEGPMHNLLERGLEWEASPNIVDVSIFGGFPYADFPEAGTSIVVTATDTDAGERCAGEIGRYAWSIRDSFLKKISNVPEAVAQAVDLVASAPGKPVVLADVADNPGGGGSGDTTELLHELVRRKVGGAAASIWDPETVKQAMSVGVGNMANFRIGGKAAPGQYGDPLEVRGRVALLSDGRFTGWGPVVRGQSVTCGPTARIDVDGLKLVITSVRHAANDRGYFHVAGIQPEHEPLLVIKSRGHFRADFEPIAQTIIEVDAPGAANPNLDRFTFQHVRRPIWPLDRDLEWNG
jgi:microcystin degradation protein MlrC